MASTEIPGSNGKMAEQAQSQDAQVSQSPSLIPAAESVIRRGKTRSLGIHGARRTGKTCYLAVTLYGRGADDSGSILLGDDESIDTLKTAWEMLEEGRIPDANAVTVPTTLRFSFLSGGIRWPVETWDYAGALVQRQDDGTSELREEVKEWLVASHAILIFVGADVCEGAREVREHLSEIELLLDRLLRESPDGNTISKPLGLVLTKWDLQGLVPDGPDDEERARQFLREHPAFQQIAAKIDQAGERVKVFPVSAFGAHRDGNLPPEGGPRPYNLLAPLRWALEMSDEALYENARQEAERYVGQDRWWKAYGPAIQRYQRLIRDQGINKGPLHDRISADLRPLVRAHRLRRAWQAGLGICLVAAAVLVPSWFHYDGIQESIKRWGQRAGASDVMPSELQDLREAAASETKRCRASWNPIVRLLSGASERRCQQVVDASEERLRQLEQSDFDRLKARHEQPLPEELEARLRELAERRKAVEVFLADWPDSRYSQPKRWREEHEDCTVFAVYLKNCLPYPDPENGAKRAEFGEGALKARPESKYATEIRSRAAEDRREFKDWKESQDFAHVEDFRRIHAEPDDAELRLENIDKFREAHPDLSPEHDAQITQWRNEDLAAIETKKREKMFLDAYSVWVQEKGEKDHDDEAIIILCERFLAQWLKETCPNPEKLQEVEQEKRNREMIVDEREWTKILKLMETDPTAYAEIREAARAYAARYTMHRDEAERLIEKMNRAENDAAWKRVNTYALENPSSYDEVIRRAKEYLASGQSVNGDSDGGNVPSPAHAESATRLVTETNKAWVAALKDKFQSRTNTIGELLQVRDEARTYQTFARDHGIDGAAETKPEFDKIQPWVDWASTFNAQKQFYVKVVAVTIPKGCALDEGSPEIDITVTINNQSSSMGEATVRGGGARTPLDKQVGPFTVAEGSQVNASIRVVEFDYYMGSDDKAEAQLPPQPRNEMPLRMEAEATCNKGPVRVELEVAMPPKPEP